MAQLRNLVLSSLFLLVPLASLRATGIFREQTIPGPPGGVTELVGLAYSRWWFTEFDANRIGMLTRDGQFQEFIVRLRTPVPAESLIPPLPKRSGSRNSRQGRSAG